MERSTRFSNTQLTLVTVNCVIAKLFLIFPSSFSTLGGSAGILLAVYTCLLGGVFVWGVSYFYRAFPGMDLIAVTKHYLGKWAGVLLTCLIIVLFTLNQALFLRSIIESIKISVLPRSPMLFSIFVYMAGVLLCSWTGLKALIRAHAFIVPYTVVMAVLLYLSAVGNYNASNIFPILGNGAGMFAYGLLLASYFADFLVLMLLMPFAEHSGDFGKIAGRSWCFTSLLLLATIASYTLTVSYQSSGRFLIPVFRIAQYIDYGSFISRLESVFSVGWFLCFFASSALHLYLIAMLTGRLTGRRRSRPYMLSYAILISALSMYPQNTAEVLRYTNAVATPRLIVGILIPLAVLCTAYMRKNKRRKGL